MKERMFYVLFLFYFNAMSASLEKDKQLLNGLSVEIKATNQDPSSLPPAPPVLIIEKDELLEGVIQRLTAERDESKTSLLALVRQNDLVEDYRKRELANQTQRADLSEMALFNYHQRFVLLSNELETKCNEERESKIRLFYTQQEVESLRAARPHMTHFSQQVFPSNPRFV